MSRRPYVFLGGDVSGAPLGFAPQPSHLRALDQYSSELVNAEDGGSWAPEEPIILSPLGTPTITLGTSGSLLSGDIETGRDNELGAELDVPGLILQSGAVPVFQTPRTRKVTVGFSTAIYAETAPTAVDLACTDPTTLGMVYLNTNGLGGQFFCAPVPIRGQHRGATIAQVDFRFIVVANPQTALPSGGNEFACRIVKVTGDTLSFMHTNAGGYDTAGWLIDPATTAADWRNNGQVRVLSYVPNQNHTNLDPATSWLFLQFKVGSNVKAGTKLLAATISLTNIADYRQE